jgi:Transaldolase/Fructose-6-phosphate aldolase
MWKLTAGPPVMVPVMLPPVIPDAPGWAPGMVGSALDQAREPRVAVGDGCWLDTLSRELLDSGGFAELVRDWGVTGATSNPTIFAKAITGSDRYDDQLRKLVAGGERDPQELFFALALDDVRAAARLLRPVYEGQPGRRRVHLVRVHARPGR